MSSTFSLLLAASLAVGSDPSNCPTCQTGSSVQMMPSSQPGLRGWWRQSVFGRSRTCTTCTQTMPKTYTQPITSVQPVQSIVVETPVVSPTQTVQPAAVNIVSTEKPAEPNPLPEKGTEKAGAEKATLQVAKKYEDRVGHDENYNWVTGHLFFVHADGGRWVVRYAVPDEVDKFGGSVVLAAGVEMKNFREGDLVCVQGQVLDESRTSRSLGGALYRADHINIVERADP